ncbi:MAG: hypothetical protein QOD96_209 [Pseudonocardiales bacterium]|nr:hypothetical protein [Pseudonocardiales bacterium]
MLHLATVSEISGPSLDQTGGLHSVQVRLGRRTRAWRRIAGPARTSAPAPTGIVLSRATLEPGGRARPAHKVQPHTRYRVAPTTMRSFGAQPAL